MADERQGDLQRLARTIVVDLMSHEQNTPTDTAVSNTSSNGYESINEELNNKLSHSSWGFM